MAPAVVNVSVHTACKQHQRICARNCALAFSVDWALLCGTYPCTTGCPSPKCGPQCTDTSQCRRSGIFCIFRTCVARSPNHSCKRCTWVSECAALGKLLRTHCSSSGTKQMHGCGTVDSVTKLNEIHTHTRTHMKCKVLLHPKNFQTTITHA